jgi:beta-D-xylosidase 4
MLDMTLRPNGNNPGRTYRWFKGAIQPFGFGLHYTTFEAKFSSNSSVTYDIADIMKGCKNQYPDTCVVPELGVAVKNTGNKTSDFVAMAFIKGDVGPKPYPLKTLISYARLRDIAGAETKSASLKFTLGNLARVDESGNMVLYPGDYTILLDEPVQAELKVKLVGNMTVLDKWPQPKK